MKKNYFWMLAAILICGTMTVLTSCSKDEDNLSTKVADNTVDEMQLFNSVVENVKADLAEADFQDLAPLTRALTDGTAEVYSADLDGDGMETIIANLAILLDSSQLPLLENLSKTLQYAMDVSIAFEKTADNKYIGDREYIQSLIVKVNDDLTYTITFDVQRNTEFSLAALDSDALRTLTIYKNGKKVVSFVNTCDFDLDIQEDGINVARLVKGVLKYKNTNGEIMKFAYASKLYNINDIASRIKYTKDNNEVFDIYLKGKNNISLENLLSKNIKFKGKVEASFYDGIFEINENIEYSDNQLWIINDGEKVSFKDLLDNLMVNLRNFFENLLG